VFEIERRASGARFHFGYKTHAEHPASPTTFLQTKKSPPV